MKVYKTIDNWYFGTEEDARKHCDFLNRCSYKNRTELEKFTGLFEDESIAMTTYEELDFDKPEVVIDLLDDYNKLKGEIEEIKEWIHFGNKKD